MGAVPCKEYSRLMARLSRDISLRLANANAVIDSAITSMEYVTRAFARDRSAPDPDHEAAGSARSTLAKLRDWR